jgi:DNA-binding MarR family transcriptional regulator
MKSINAMHRAQAIYRTRMMGDELSAAHHTFIFAITANPGKTQDELSSLLCLNKSTVARVIAQLEERGLCKRVPNPKDKREQLVYPTDDMLALLPRVREVARAWADIISEGITGEELQVFASVISRMEINAKRALEVGEK